jgi:nitrogen regulatory protein PII
MRLGTANLQPFRLDVLSDTSSIPSFVPNVRIDLVAASTRADRVMAAIQDIARTGQVGDGKILVAPLERAVRTGETDKGAG